MYKCNNPKCSEESIYINEDTGLSNSDERGFRSLELITEGCSVTEMIENASIFYIDQDGGECGEVRLVNLGGSTYDTVVRMIQNTLKQTKGKKMTSIQYKIEQVHNGLKLIAYIPGIDIEGVTYTYVFTNPKAYELSSNFKTDKIEAKLNLIDKLAQVQDLDIQTL